MSTKKLKVALIHDFLREYGGAERVLEVLHEMFPDAPVYVAFLDKKSLGKHWTRFKDWKILETWFAKIPLHKKWFSPMRLLAPKAFSSLDLSEYDLVISSSNAFEAKAVVVPNGKHFCYCHTPPRALYGYSTMSDWKKNFLIKFGGNLINHFMRVVDFKHAQNVDVFMANSEETQARIKKFYRRDSTVVYPPVSLPLSSAKLKKIKQESKQDYYFYIGRLGLQKHPELAVQVCSKLGLKLKLAGTGPMLGKLKEIAEPTIDFLGAVDDVELAGLYAGAKALLYPVEDEDFGMVPVEAMMAGTPVIAHRSGGPQYFVKDEINGVLFDNLSVESLAKAIKQFETKKFETDKIMKSAQKFSRKVFERSLRALISPTG